MPYKQEALQLLGFDFGGGAPPNPATASARDTTEQKAYDVPEDRAIGRPHMMGWLDLLGDDEELTGGDKKEGSEKEAAAETFEADKWEEVNA